MAVENALLGLLRREPRHGYELAREFAPDTPLGEVVHLEPGSQPVPVQDNAKQRRNNPVESTFDGHVARAPVRFPDRW